MQVKNLERGFSFESKGSLDMRMGINQFSAKDVLNKLNQKSNFNHFKIFWG